MALRTIRLTIEAFGGTPALDIAVSRAILQGVADGAEPETLRLYTPAASVVFGPQDSTRRWPRPAPGVSAP